MFSERRLNRKDCNGSRVERILCIRVPRFRPYMIAVLGFYDQRMTGVFPLLWPCRGVVIRDLFLQMGNRPQRFSCNLANLYAEGVALYFSPRVSSLGIPSNFSFYLAIGDVRKGRNVFCGCRGDEDHLLRLYMYYGIGACGGARCSGLFRGTYIWVGVSLLSLHPERHVSLVVLI